MTTDTNLPDPVSAIATLDEPKRRQLYDYVAARHEGVGRDEAAAASGMSRELASFHLDRLVDAGLLIAEFRRLNGRSGPGAGRPAKVYRRSPGDVVASFPTRDTSERRPCSRRHWSGWADARAPVRPRLTDVARASGQAAGADARHRAGSRPGRRRLRTVLLELLTRRRLRAGGRARRRRSRGSGLPAELSVRRPRRRPPRPDLRDEPGLGGGPRRRPRRGADRATGPGRGLLLRGARRRGAGSSRPASPARDAGRDRRLTAMAAAAAARPRR